MMLRLYAETSLDILKTLNVEDNPFLCEQEQREDPRPLVASYTSTIDTTEQILHSIRLDGSNSYFEQWYNYVAMTCKELQTITHIDHELIQFEFDENNVVIPEIIMNGIKKYQEIAVRGLICNTGIAKQGRLLSWLPGFG
jgi:hypothetical protein